MLKKRIRKLLPVNYAYKNAKWYQSLEKEYDNYRYKLVLALLISASLIPLYFAISDILKGISEHIINYAIPFILLFFFITLLIITKKSTIFSIFSLLICITGFILTLFLPNSRNIYIVTFFSFIPIAFQLRGTIKGAIWIIFFLLIVMLTYIFHAFGFLHYWNIKFSENDLISGFITLLLIFILTFLGEKQHEKETDIIIKKILFDEITNLPNRTVLIDSIQKNKIYLFSIIYIENFSNLGLIFGYDLSDEILLFISNQLEKWKATFNYDIFRLKGNEFGILMPLVNHSRNEALEILKKIWIALQSKTMPWDDTELRINIMLGGVLFNSNNSKESKDFISKADLALKSCIESHQGVTLFKGHENLKTTAYDSINLFSILYKNYENKTYKAYFQPIVDSSTGKIVWYESLLRICNSQGVYESPVKYLPIAESTGLYNNLTQFMIEESCKVLNFTDKNISINISFQDMLRENFIKILSDNYKINNNTKGRLILEILEKFEISEMEVCLKFIKRVKELGCLIAIDDFGSGYSNFGNLLKLPVDIIKIDGSLIQQIKNNNAKIMVENIVNFCKQTGFLITAEFVDSTFLVEELKKIGVDFLQGFHFGKPSEIIIVN